MNKPIVSGARIESLGPAALADCARSVSRPVHPTTLPRSATWASPVRGSSIRHRAIAECIRSGSVWEAESNIEWLDLVSTPAPADSARSIVCQLIG
jgi:hypothetical protein